MTHQHLCPLNHEGVVCFKLWYNQTVAKNSKFRLTGFRVFDFLILNCNNLENKK